MQGDKNAKISFHFKSGDKQAPFR